MDLAKKINQGAEIAKRLKKLYPVPVVELDYTTPFELLIASLLAAQNRDTTINKITPNIFRKYRGPADYVAVDPAELEQDIHLSGFFRQKTKAIKALSQNGQAPVTRYGTRCKSVRGTALRWRQPNSLRRRNEDGRECSAYGAD
jgi:endonuclease III